MTLKTPQDQQAVNARPTPQWDFAPEGALASSPQVGLGGAGGRALLSSILNAYVQKTGNPGGNDDGGGGGGPGADTGGGGGEGGGRGVRGG